MKKIKIKEALGLDDKIFIDTRSPIEFKEDNISGSINLPILDNEERKAVGVLYKKDEKKAIDLGYDYYFKKLSRLKDTVNKISKEKKIIVYCFRGGMRSSTITKLIEDIGYDTFQLEGGYKSYRAYIREYFNNLDLKSNFIVLQGHAGSKKTEIIKKLSPAIDLEGLAMHRSSIFGGLGLSPRKQKMFESVLYVELEKLKDEKIIFIEGESKKIGDIFIPEKLFYAMEKGVYIKIECSMKQRIKQIRKDYFTHDVDDKIISMIISLKKFFSKKSLEKLLELMDKKEYDEVIRILLEEHYDLRYSNIIDKLDYSYTINSDSVKKAVDEINKINFS